MESMPDDAALVHAAAGGDRHAFEQLYRRHAAWLTARLRYRCADPGLAEDVVQETFLAVWRGTATLRDPARSDVAAWLWTLAVRRLVDATRKEHSIARLLRRLAGWRTPHEAAAEDQVLVAVEHGDLAGSLARLSPELRAVVQATVLDGLSTREAAVLLGIPPGTVKTRAMRARQQLRRELT
jgi:RNA polymerase sigma-70 factor, ECF subfamily